jgi:cbb3-type cytochrome oxidase subunit 3
MKEITPLLQQLAQKLGTTTTYLWKILVQQALISSIADVVLILLLIPCWIFMYKMHRKLVEEDNYEEVAPGISMLLGGIALIIVTIMSIFKLPLTIAGFVNPEYWALYKIIESIGHTKIN